MTEIVSVDNSYLALRVLRAEKARRTEFAWKCRDGRTVPVKEMDDTHLENAIALLERIETERDIVLENLTEVF